MKPPFLKQCPPFRDLFHYKLDKDDFKTPKFWNKDWPKACFRRDEWSKERHAKCPTINIYSKYITILREVSAINQNFLRLHTLRDLCGAMNCWVRDRQVCINAPGQKDSVPCVRHLCHFYSKDADPEMEEGHAHFLGVFQLGNVLKERMILLVCMFTRRSHKKHLLCVYKND